MPKENLQMRNRYDFLSSNLNIIRYKCLTRVPELWGEMKQTAY